MTPSRSTARGQFIAAASSVVLFALSATNVVKQTSAHPNCVGDFSPAAGVESIFCPNEYADGFCCNTEEETMIQTNFEATGTTGRCAEMHQEVLCGICHPWSGHLFERLEVAMTLTNDFCDEFVAECGTQLSLVDEYCDYHTGGDEDQFWSYPLVIDDTFNSDGLVKAFPDVDDGDLPTQPMDMRMTPDGTTWWVAGLEGEIVELPAEGATGTTQVMDISDKILLTFEEGLLSFAFSPDFHTSGVFYVSYVIGPSFGANVLSRFQYDATSTANTVASEEVLITSSAKQSNVHSAGWIGFKPSAYASQSSGSNELYWSMGDAGPQLDTFENGQSSDTLHGSIIRIIVSSEMNSGYSIPSDNPFSGGGGLGEICAQGFRNPYRCSFDRENDDLYCGDVGHLNVESVKKIECGNNYGWRQFEGDRCMFQIESEFEATCEFLDRSPFTFPIFDYCHPDYYTGDEPDYVVSDTNLCGDRSVVGTAVIGGFIYRGTKFFDLIGGNYIFADYSYQALYHLFPNDGGWDYGVIDDEDFLAVSSFGEDNNGELYVIGYKNSIYELPCGNLCSGEGANPVTDEPYVPPALPTNAPAAAPTDAPVGDAPTPSPIAPTPAPVPPGETATPMTPAPTGAPAAVSPTPSPAETINITPSPVFQRTASPVVVPEPLGSRTASPERTDDDFDRSPIRTATEPPVSTPLIPATLSPAAGAPVDNTPAPMLPVEEPTPAAPTPDEAPVAAPTPDEAPVVAPTPDGAAPTEPPVDVPTPAEVYPSPFVSGEPHSAITISPEDLAVCDMDFGEDVVPITDPAAEVSPAEFLGCYVDTIEDRVMSLGMHKSDNMTPALCEDYCRTIGGDMYGLQYSEECFCGDSRDVDLAVHGESTTCDMACTGDSSDTCGGRFSIEAYYMGGGVGVPVGSTYLGCQGDTQADRVLGDAGFTWCGESMTIPLCEQFCRGKEAAVYGLQYGHECWCGAGLEYDRHGPGVCNYRCSGDLQTTCGGFDAISVYSLD